jgi:hypothetical protein
MPSENAPVRESESQKRFKAAPKELRDLVKQIMTKERQEQHKRNRQDIYQDLLQYIRESAQ